MLTQPIMRAFIIITVLFSTTFTACNQSGQSEIDLSGTWQFMMDPDDAGESEKWFDRELIETVKLPGSMVENGKGFDIDLETQWTGGIQNSAWYTDPNYAPYHDPDNIRFPYWLQPEKKYTGASWYIKKVNIPVSWKDEKVHLFLERPHWESTIWVNGNPGGKRNSLATPHIYDISQFILPGENSIAIRIDNRIKEVDVGVNSHSITDHTQTNWNGIVGDILLLRSGGIGFEDVKVFPDIVSRTIEITVRVNNDLKEERDLSIVAQARHKGEGTETEKKSWEFSIVPGENTLRMTYPMGPDALLWDEFNPNVYELSLGLRSGKEEDACRLDFGLREFKADGVRFSINGRPVFLRGTLECAIFPLTGYPPTGPEYWRKIYSAVKDHGLNHVRFHSWCPPEAAFEAADKMGVYLQVECSSWANGSTELGSGLPVDQYIWEESRRIVEAYGNHPSFVMMAYGNEPGGPNHRSYLAAFVNYWKETDPRRVYTSAAGWPNIKENNYHNIPAPRIQGWGEELNSIINARPPQTQIDWRNKLPGDGIPVVSHEIGQWCVYPNFKEIEKYTGVLKPKNFELFSESLDAHHMGHLADSFLLASGKLQALCYKAEIEAALRTPGFAGFQLLDLHDFPGQGTALVGVLDPFWEEKGYISPEEFRRFCNTTVPLARLEKRIFTEGETMTAYIEVAHFGEFPFEKVKPEWEILENEEIVARGTLAEIDIPIGNEIELGQVIYGFEKEDRPRKLTLQVRTGEFENSWDIWVYPEFQTIENGDFRVVEKLDHPTINYLVNGGKVLLSLGKAKVSAEMGGEVGVGFSSIFWNTAWTRNQKPHTLGILCNPEHPALQYFPTEYHSNWQWWDAMSHADAIRLDAISAEIDPVVQIIDDWVTNRKLALIFEARVGGGSILVSGADLVNNLDTRPEARQLLYSLKKYITGTEFHPKDEMAPLEIQSILK